MLLDMVMTHEIGHFFGLDPTVSGIMASVFDYDDVRYAKSAC
jgi:hypothetical protein